MFFYLSRIKGGIKAHLLSVFIFIFVFTSFVFFLTPNINTGDAGGLITATHYLGIAHPSGYPLYLLVAKILTFLPLGNMAFKVALVSAIFSATSLVLVFYAIYVLTESRLAGLFGVIVIFVSYSFFTQSVIAKFYPLNLFLILLIFVIWLLQLRNKISVHYTSITFEQAAYITAFILGIMTANHHTGILISVPVILAIIALRSSMRLKIVVIMALLFFMGFILNIYLLIRGTANNFFNVIYINNLDDFFKVFFRQVYKESGTLTLAVDAFQNLSSYWVGTKNFIYIMAANFSAFSWLLFFVGLFFACNKDRILFFYILLSLIIYGPFLSRLTFSFSTLSERDYYVIAHQYFLPAIAFFVLFTALGFHQIVQWVRRMPMVIIHKILPPLLAFFPLVFLIARFADSDYKTNYVPYQLTKDTYSMLPVNSIFLTYGDEAIFQSFYLKLIGRYREDICQPAVPKKIDAAWRFQGCNERLYSNIFPGVFTLNVRKMVPYMLQKRFYASGAITENFPYNRYLYSKMASLLYLYMPLETESASEENVDNFALNFTENSEKFINHMVCLEHFTDDFSTRMYHCMKYYIYLLELSKIYSGENDGNDEGENFSTEIVFFEDQKQEYSLKYNFRITSKNEPYLNTARGINNFNKWKLFYMRRKE